MSIVNSIDKPLPTPRRGAGAADEPRDPVGAPHRTSGGRFGLWTVCILLIVTILVVAGVSIWQLHRHAMATAEREMSNLGVVLAEQTSRTVQAVDLVLREV